MRHGHRRCDPTVCAQVVWLAVLSIAVPGLCSAPHPAGHRARLRGHTVLHLAGDGPELGAQHARLAGRLIRQVVNDVIIEGEGAGRYEELIRGAMVMEKYLPDDYKAELRALADGTGCEYQDIVALQLFGDVERGQQCTSYAVFGPATRTGECIVGRNMDYWDHGVTRYAACLIHYYPARGIPFMTTSWCGIINGWTAMNDYGIVCANNSSFGAKTARGSPHASWCAGGVRTRWMRSMHRPGDAPSLRDEPHHRRVTCRRPHVEYDHGEWRCAGPRATSRWQRLPRASRQSADDPEDDQGRNAETGCYYLSRDEISASSSARTTV